MLRRMALLAACASPLIGSATVHTASSPAFFDARVTVVRSCRISTDALDVGGARLEIGPTPLARMCDAAAAAQITLGPTASHDHPIARPTLGLIASAEPSSLPESRVPPTTLRLTIDF